MQRFSVALTKFRLTLLLVYCYVDRFDSFLIIMKPGKILDLSMSSIQSSAVKKVNHYEATVSEILQADTLDGLIGKIESQIDFLSNQ